MDILLTLQRFADNSITDSERAEFAAYLKGLSPEAYEALMEQYEAIDEQSRTTDRQSRPAEQRSQSADRQNAPAEPAAAALLDRIMATIDLLQPLERAPAERLERRIGQPLAQAPGEPVEGAAGEFRRRRLFHWPALAAAATVLIVAAIYFFRPTPHRAAAGPQSTAAVTSIGPGGNKAVLTLSNGTSIVLDSATNGRLSNEGATDVVKLANGKLKYRTAADQVDGYVAAADKAGKHAGAGEPNSQTGRPGNRDAILYNTLTTPRGGQYQVVLSDGTTVWLNAASAIRYPTAFTGASREVEVQGEAYFEVARDKSHPFRVSVLTAGGRPIGIDVLGTDFNVNAYADEGDKAVKTTLVAGAVRVSKGSKALLLRPGQQAATAPDNNAIGLKNDVDLETVMAWKNGKLAFSKGSIRELMQEISRWYDVDIHYQGKVPSGGFYGLIDRNVPLASVLRVLKAYGIQTRLENKTIIVQ